MDEANRRDPDPLPDIRCRAEAAQKALAAALAIARAWQLSPRQQEVLLGLKHTTDDVPQDECSGPRLSPEALARVHYVLTIDAALHVLLPSPERANAWVQRPNLAAQFNGEPALSRMLTGRLDDLRAVAAHLQSMISGDFS